MNRRVALWVVGLVAYGGALLAFLFGLERLFIAERDDARQDLAAQRRALETYAEKSLRQAMRERLDLAEPEFDRAFKDPYVDDSNLRLIVDGEVVLPRVETGTESRARAQYEALRAGQLSASHASSDDEREPMERQLSVVLEVAEHSQRCEATKLAAATQRLLSEEALYQLPLWCAAPIQLVLVESLARCEAVNPELLRRLLRDGMPLRDGGGVSEGLQRSILRRRSSLSPDDMRFLCERTSALSERLGVDATDFKLRCVSQESLQGWAGLRDEGEWLMPAWFLRTRGTVTRAVRVDVRASLESIRAEMTDRGLLAPGDSLGENTVGGAALDAVRVGLGSDALAELERRADRRLTAKTGLLVAFAALAVALAAGAVVSQRRKQRYLELKSDFVAAVSHELRTPLASLRVMAETLEHRLEGEPRAKDYPRRMVAEAEALSGLVENILSFNRLDKDRWVAHPRSLALAEFQKSLEDEGHAYGLAQVELSFDGFAEERAEADPELLKLLFSNLLRNACRYNANDPVRVRFAASREPAGLFVRVFDNGVGIPPEAQQEVFEEFKRLKGQAGRGGPGSGLGLSLCRRIMGLHGGTLTLEASSTAGSTFLMHFPNA